MSDIVSALADHSGIPLNVKKKYAGDVEVEETSSPLTGREALEAAKSRAKGGKKRPSVSHYAIADHCWAGRGKSNARI